MTPNDSLQGAVHGAQVTRAPDRSAVVAAKLRLQSRAVGLAQSAAFAAVVLGAAVLTGWTLDIGALKTVLPGLAAMVPNTALSFVLAGAALALAPWKGGPRARSARALAMGVFAIAALTLVEMLTDADFGIDELLFADHGSPLANPGRMALATGIAFAAAGTALFVLPSPLPGTLPGQRFRVARALSIAVAAIGATGLLGYVLDLEVLYSWYAYRSVALHTAAGLVALGTGIWLAGMPQRPVPTDEARIATRATVLLALAAAAVGTLGFAVAEHQTKAGLAHGFEATLKADASHLRSALRNHAEQAAIIATRPDLLRHLRLLAANPRDAESRIAVQGVIDSFVTHGFTAVVLTDRDGVDIARVGRSIEFAVQELKVDPDAGISLVWSNGVHLRRTLHLADASGPLGTVRAEQFLPEVTAALARAREFGRTSVLMLCAPGPGGFECLPTHLNPAASTLSTGARGLEPLAQRALKGEQGFAPGLYERGHRVLAGYAPIGASRLVTLLTVEAAEAYRPLARHFQLALLLVAGISVAGYFLLRRWVLPLADSLGQRVQARTAELSAATAELARSEQRFRATIESAPAAMALVDQSGTIVVVNGALETMFGYKREELLQQKIEILIPERFRAAHPGVRARYFAAPEARPMGAGSDFLGRRKDGSEVPVEVGLSPVRVGGESLVIATIADRTERRRAEAILRRTNEALERSNIELQRFAHVASHDLQTPMRGIASFVDLLQSTYGDRLDERARDWIGRITRSVGQLQDLIRDLLEYSSVDSHPQRFEAVPLHEVFEQVASLLDAAVRESGAQLTCGELPTVMGDRSQLVQLMLNLVGNSIKYRGTETPRVHVSAERGADGWRIGVRDNGIGIAARHQERIFGMLERLHDRRQYPGSGIGLAVCRRVVQRHGGRIWVESEPGSGSVFYFTIPEGMESVT